MKGEQAIRYTIGLATEDFSRSLISEIIEINMGKSNRVKAVTRFLKQIQNPFRASSVILNYS